MPAGSTLEAYLKTRDGGDLLDIACGGGAFSRKLADNLKSCQSVTGLDIRSGLEADFIKNVDVQNVAFVASPISDFLDSGRSFNTISVSNALHHLEDVEAVLGRLHVLLKPGGVVVISEMYADDLTPAQETQRRMHSMMARLHRVSGEFHRAPFTRAELDSMVRHAGFTVLHRFQVANTEARVRNDPGESGGMADRFQNALDQAYPDGAPPEVVEEIKQIKDRAAKTGVAPPPLLILVCTS